MKVIDGHTHVFSPEIIGMRDRIARKEGGFALIYGNGTSKMADADALFAYMAADNVDGCVVCGFPFKDRGLITLQNDYLLEVAANNPNIFPLISVDTGDERHALKELERCRARGALGVGEAAFYEKGLGRNELAALEGIARRLEESGAVLMLHVNEQVGHPYKGKTVVDFPETVRFIESHPNLDVVLAHLGGGLCFYEFMPEIRRVFSRVYYDTAAVPFLYGETIYTFIDGFLADKTVFGSDFPLLTFSRYSTGVSRMRPDTRGKTLYSNARRLFART